MEVKLAEMETRRERIKVTMKENKEKKRGQLDENKSKQENRE